MRPDHSLTILAREAFRWYLRRFPLKDGKAFFYRRLQEKLMPPGRWAVARLRRGFTLCLDLTDADQRRLYFYGDYDEAREADLITRVLEPGEVFWDVGANVGYFTLLAAACLKNTGQVAAFEPGSEAFARLAENISLNPFTNIVPCRLAAADREGEAVLYARPGLADGRANIFRPGEGQVPGERVPTVTLDRWRQDQGCPGPHFVKLDVEGAELAALKGAARTLASFAPLLLVEMKAAVFQALGTDPLELQEFLARQGYRPAGLIRRRWRLSETLAEFTGRNVLWLKPEVAWHRRKARRAGLQGPW